MTHLALTVALIAFVYFLGYYIGRKQVVDEIREMTKELEEKSHDAIKM